MDPPLCECHGKPMLWRNDSRRRNGGNFTCEVNYREKKHTWATSPEGRASKKAYRQSEKGKASKHRYQHSEKGLAVRERHEAHSIQIAIGGERNRYYVDPDKKDETRQKINEFKSRQREEYREESNGWIDTTES